MIALPQPTAVEFVDVAPAARIDIATDDGPADVLPLRFTNAGKKTYRVQMVRRNPFCIYCGEKLTQDTATLEHFHPRSAGGDHHPWNLFLSCAACNSERSSRDIPEWVAELRAKADRLEAAYRRMLGIIDDSNAALTSWPVAIAFQPQEAQA